MKYKARVRCSIKRKNVNPTYRDKIENEIGFQVMLNFSMTRWVPKSTGATWAVVSQWVTEL
jgi:hypothetical protein